MALKPQITIDLDDAKFVAFKESFDKLQAALKAMPDLWGATASAANEAIGDAQAAADAASEQAAAQRRKAEQDAEKAHEATRKWWREQNAQMVFAEKFQNRFADAVKRTIDPMERVVKAVGRIQKNVAGATLALIRWAGIGSIISGLMGGVGLFGLDRLGLAAAGQARSAAGTGVSVGEQNAFRLNYNRYVDPDRVMGGAATGKANPSSTERRALMAMGFTAAQIEQMDPAELAVQATSRARGMYERYHGNQQALDATGITSMFSMDDLRRLQHARPEDLQNSERDYRRDAQRLDVNDSTNRSWQTFITQLERAGQVIENSLIRGLVGLTEPLGKLSEAFGKAIETFLHSDLFRHWIDVTAEGLQHFADWLNAPGTQQKFDTFIKDIEKVSEVLERFVVGLYHLMEGAGSIINPQVTVEHDNRGPGSGPAPSTANRGFVPWDMPHGDHPGTTWGDFMRHPFGGHDAQPDDRPGHTSATVPGLQGGIGGTTTAPPNVAPDFIPQAYHPGGGGLPIHNAAFQMPGAGGIRASASVGPQDPGMFRSLEDARGLPHGFLWNIYGAESSYGRDPSANRENSAHAMGPFQFTPGTASQYGLRDRNNLQESASAAAAYLADLTRQFGGDTAKAAAAYNWGPGHLQRDIEQHGADWRRFVPRETEHYIEVTADRLGAANRPGGGAPSMNRTVPQQSAMGGGVRIIIANTTGGSAVAAVSALAPS